MEDGKCRARIFYRAIEGDGDIVTIKGERKRPQGEHFQLPTAEGREKFLGIELPCVRCAQPDPGV